MDCAPLSQPLNHGLIPVASERVSDNKPIGSKPLFAGERNLAHFRHQEKQKTLMT